MTEQEWLKCKTPHKMLEFLQGRTSERKLRLFACSCCRRIPASATYARARKAIEVAERYADGLASRHEMREAGKAADRGATWVRDGTRSAAVAASQACSSLRETAYFRTCLNVLDNDAPTPAAMKKERAILAGLLRDLVGPLPFRAVTVDPSWLSWDAGAIPKMAQAIYEDCSFAELPILADALEEAGCSDADILAHCRRRGEHARGCWVLDLILARK
jgi:hypothetical protein